MSDTEKTIKPAVIKITYSNGDVFEVTADAFVLAVSPTDATRSTHTVIYGSGWDTAALWKVAEVDFTKVLMKYVDIDSTNNTK